MARVARRALSVGFLVAFAAVVVYLGAVRPTELRWGATDEELARRMPGDMLVSNPSVSATRAITIKAPPDRVWPWIAQMGTGRAGFYGYDWLDNGGTPSATMIVPDLQRLEAGDAVTLGARPGGGYRVKGFQANRYLLWMSVPGRAREGGPNATWCWELRPAAGGMTRVVMRLRLRRSWPSLSALTTWPLEVAEGFLTRKCLLGIKARVESTRIEK